LEIIAFEERFINYFKVFDDSDSAVFIWLNNVDSIYIYIYFYICLYWYICIQTYMYINIYICIYMAQIFMIQIGLFLYDNKLFRIAIPSLTYHLYKLIFIWLSGGLDNCYYCMFIFFTYAILAGLHYLCRE
jgi:hypothetical protein